MSICSPYSRLNCRERKRSHLIFDKYYDYLYFITIPSEINFIVDKLNRELDEIEQVAIEGQNISRSILDRFPNNARLVQFFVTFSNALLFTELERRRIKSIIKNTTLLG